MSPLRLDVPPALRPKRRAWFLGFLVVALVSLVAYIAIAVIAGWSPGALGGLIFGGLAAGVMGLEVLYALRRRLLVAPLKTGQAWLQAHVYGGTLAALFVFIHIGFRWPHGTFGLALYLLTVLTTISGLLGVLLQKTVPTTLTSAIAVEAIYERIPDMVADLRTQADDAVKGSSDMLQRFYGSHVQPALAGPNVSLAYLMDVHAGRERLVTDFKGIQSFLAGEDQTRASQLQQLVTRKMDLEAHYTWQNVLRKWLLFHVPLAMLLVATIVAHIAAVWRY
jgi:hypothetical protein